MNGGPAPSIHFLRDEERELLLSRSRKGKKKGGPRNEIIRSVKGGSSMELTKSSSPARAHSIEPGNRAQDTEE